MEITADQAQAHFSDLLERVSKGEQFAITKDGIRVAMLVSFSQTPKTDVRAVIAELKSFAKGRTTDGMSIREMIEEGRRGSGAYCAACFERFARIDWIAGGSPAINKTVRMAHPTIPR